jgi:hypothetical protein
MQHRTFDSLGCVLVSVIVFDIDHRCGPILLTDSVKASRIAISGNVLSKNVRPEETLAKGIVEDRFRIPE